MNNNSDNQSNADVMEWIAFGGVIVFGLGMAYAIHTTNQVVQAVDANHSKKIIINSETTNVQQGVQQSGQTSTSTEN